MDIERVRYLSNFEELVNEYGIGIQHVFGEDEHSPGFSYTVGLFEAGHPEFIAFGFSHSVAQTVLNDLANQVFQHGQTFQGNQEIHQLFEGAPAHLITAHDPHDDYLCTAYSIRDRRYPARAGTELQVLQLIVQDPQERWPWDPGSDYADWPMLGPWPDLAKTHALTIARD